MLAGLKALPSVGATLGRTVDGQGRDGRGSIAAVAGLQGADSQRVDVAARGSRSHRVLSPYRSRWLGS